MDDLCFNAQTENQPTTSFLWCFVERAKKLCSESTPIYVIPLDRKLPANATKANVERVSVDEKKEDGTSSMTAVGKKMRGKMRNFISEQFYECSDYELMAMMLVCGIT